MRAIAAPFLIAAALAGTAASAQTPRELRDIVRMSIERGETQLSRRGYDPGRETSPFPDEIITYWQHRTSGRCIAVAERGGRVARIDSQSPVLCESGSGGTAAAPSPADYGAGNADTRRDRRSGYDDRQANRIYDRGASLFLLCYADARNPDVRAAYGVDNRDRSGARDGDAEIQVEVWGTRGRIRLPSGAWQDLENIRDTGDRITGRFTAGLSNTRVDIDRRLGKIRIDGAQPFRGNCDLGETTGQRRRY